VLILKSSGELTRFSVRRYSASQPDRDIDDDPVGSIRHELSLDRANPGHCVNLRRRFQGTFSMINLARISSFPIVVLLVCAGGHANAQATRTWVSGVGDDANPCSRTAPCKTFPGAFSKTAAGGVIDALDPGGFGAVTITKAITLESDGTIASVLVSGTNGITVNAGPSDMVTLRGIKIVGIGTGLDGVKFNSGAGLIVERSVIENFANNGINFTPTTPATLTVRDTLIRGNGTGSGGGITIQPNTTSPNTGSANAMLERVQLVSNSYGLQVQGPASINVRNSVASTNSGNGFAVIGGANAAQLMLDNVIASENTLAGVLAQGSAAVIRLSGSTLSGNTQGIQATTGGQVISFGNNRNSGNISDGAPTSIVGLQ
jgi:hypothetical protein